MISQTKQKGFTIVELLIVIVIIAILAAISIVAYNSITQRARDTQRATDAGNIAKAIVNYNAQNNGDWLDASNAATKLAGWKDPEIPAATLAKIDGSTLDKDHFRVTACGTPQTGAKVEYYKEADTSNPGVITVGTGC